MKGLKTQIEWILREKYHGKWTQATDKDVQRLMKGESVDYIIGWAPFLDTKIDLSLRPFIPRPETEYWTEKAIQTIKKVNKRKPIRVLDLFSGSGCIGMAVLKHIPNAKVDFAEKDPRCMPQIKKSLALNKISKKRSKVIQSDVFKNVKDTYDFILANPPYIPRTNKNIVEKSVLEQEPTMALFGGKNGLWFIEKMLKGLKKHLKPGGSLWFEFDSSSKKELEQLLKKYELSFTIHKDQYKKWRYVELQARLDTP